MARIRKIGSILSTKGITVSSENQDCSRLTNWGILRGLIPFVNLGGLAFQLHVFSA